MAIGDLITLQEYLTATGQRQADLDASSTDQINWLISSVSDAIRAFTDRDFTLSVDANPSPRVYRYEGYATLEIDDASAVTQVAIVGTPWNTGRTLDVSEWFASAESNPDGILDTIELYTMLPQAMSPQMGFRNNLDMIGVVPYPVQIQVTANWGWTKIPLKVKQAAVLAVQSYSTGEDEYTSESIAGYSRSRIGSRAGTLVPTQSLPPKSVALLDAYTRMNI